MDPSSLPTTEGVYVLELEGDKYYVGYSTNIRRRVKQHFEGAGAGWTEAHKPIRVDKVLPGKTKIDETMVTLKYMKRRGWKNVRGGPYVQVHMEHPPRTGDGTTCFHCRGNHFVRDCPELNACARCGNNHPTDNCCAGYHINGWPLEPMCVRCGRQGHWVEGCYAKTDARGLWM